MAEPLSILGGVAASIQLVECATTALLGTIKFIQDLRDIPRKISSRVDDVERSSERVNYICRQVLGSGSLTADHIRPEAVARLSSCCEILRIAIDEAEAVLKPLVETSKSGRHAKALRLWNTVVSTTRESAILEKLQRVERLNSELFGELNVESLITGTTTGASVNQTASIIRTNQADFMEKFDSINQSNASIQTSIDSVSDHIKSVDLAVNHVGDIADSINYQISTFGSEMRSQFQLTHEAMERMIHLQELRMSNELRSIRDELLFAATGRGARCTTPSQMRTIANGLSHLTEQNQADLQNSLAVSLLHRPTALLDASRLSGHNKERRGQRHCNCRPRREHRITRVWNVRFESLLQAEHRDDCPWHANGFQSWSQSLSASLHPFFNRVVEISFGAATGPGAWTMLPPLKIRKIVQRRSTPVFVAFDALLEVCAQQRSYRPAQFSTKEWWRVKQYMWRESCPLFGRKHAKPFQILPNPLTAKYLEDLHECLGLEVAKGRFSGSEVDENGFSILFEFFNVIILLGKHWKDFELQLSAIFHEIVRSDVDFLATTRFDEGLRRYGIHNTPTIIWRFANVTAAEYFIDRAYTEYGSFGYEVPFYDQLVARDALSGLQNYGGRGDSKGYYRNGFAALPLKFLLRHKEVAEALEYDDLAMAILNRSMGDVKRLSKGACLSNPADEFHQHKLTYVELALGWMEGIEYLMEEGFTTAPAISLACKARDTSSLNLLLTSKEAIFTSKLDPRRLAFTASSFWALRDAIMSGCQNVLRLVVNEMMHRRTRLHGFLSGQINPENEVPKIGIHGISKLDSKFLRLGDEYSVPAELEYCSKMSPYHFVVTDQDFTDERLSLRSFANVFDIIYDCGFTDIDEPDEIKETPMFRHVRRVLNDVNDFIPDGNIFHEGEIAEWFISHGANVINQTGEGWPNILFYLALCGSIWLRSWDVDEWEGKKAKTVIESLQMTTDSCRCFCSSFGCYPTHLVLRCYGNSVRGCVYATGRVGLFRNWMKRWDIHASEKENLKREMVRLELFERLGMAHTCCRHNFHSPIHVYSPFSVDWHSESEIQLIQSDDSDLNAQLEALLAHYDLWKLGAQDLPTETLEEIWWRAVDEILPPLTTDECCKRHLSKFSEAEGPKASREEREMEALRNSGFEGFTDFREVIDIHFSKKSVEMFEVPSLPNAENCEKI